VDDSLDPGCTVTPAGMTSALHYAARQLRRGGWRARWRRRLAWQALADELGLLLRQAWHREWDTIRRFNGWVAAPKDVGAGTAAYLTGRGLTRRRAIRDLHRRRNRILGQEG
jgi:hypothetical protein